MLVVNERISAVVSLTLIGLTFYSALDFSRYGANVVGLNELLGPKTSIQWLVIVLLTGLAISGTNTVIRAHPQLSSPQLAYVVTFCTLPGLMVALSSQLLRLVPTATMWAVSLIAIAILLWLIIASQFQQITTILTPLTSGHRLIQQFVGYGLGAVSFMAIYHTADDTLSIMGSVAAVSLMVALPLLRQPPETIGKTWLYAMVIALSLGQLAWPLAYWPTRAVNVGIFLFLMLYILIGLAQQQLSGRFSRRVVWEFGLITIVALWLIFGW